MQHDNQNLTLPEPLSSTNSESTDDFDFIQAKDTKKNHKKSGKAKGASSKGVSPSPDLSLGSSPIEKIKTSRRVNQEKEYLSEFPQPATHSSQGVKSSTPLEGSIGGLAKQKSVAGRTSDNSHSSSPQSSLEGRKDAMSKQADTSFLEFCSKQSRSEAEILLVVNLGSFDPDHEFIDKFLNFKELLPADVLDIVFRSQNGHKGTSSSEPTSFGTESIMESGTQEPSIKGGGKTKNKKVKKVSPSVLGFNVVSNSIMMGEIQTVED
uniref:Uncharacterized protein n=1 Tax=Kalanchoe fedtschenkoi TaxID=63787 RepID=A0A7N0V3T7_KALFE